MVSSHHGWVPANCQQIDGEWYFLLKWRDHPLGWIARQYGKVFICTFDNVVFEVKDQGLLF